MEDKSEGMEIENRSIEFPIVCELRSPVDPTSKKASVFKRQWNTGCKSKNKNKQAKKPKH